MNIDKTRKFLFSSRLRLFLFLAITWGGLMLVFSGDYSSFSILRHIVVGSLFGLIVSASILRRRPYELNHFEDGDMAKIKRYNKAFKQSNEPHGEYDLGDYREFLFSKKGYTSQTSIRHR